MSLFSEQLKALLQDSGQTIYKISKAAGIDRTTIQRAITGERLPSVSFVELLCEYLRSSPTEKAELMEYYTIAKVGEVNYATRAHIKTLVEQIATLHSGGRQATGILHTSTMHPVEKSVTVHTGQYQVNSLVQQFLSHAAATRTALYLSVPFEYRYFFDCLLQLYWDSHGQWEITHLMTLLKNNSSPLYATHNLEAISNALPFSFCLQSGYRPSYFYQSAPPQQDLSVPMPYYFFTKDCLITLSADFKTAISHRDADVIDAYQAHFEASHAQAMPLITNIVTSLDMAATYTEVWRESGCITHVIEPQPCFARYYTDDMVETHLRQGVKYRDEIKRGVQLVFQQYQSAEAPLQSFFSVDGLRYFAATGILADLPPQYTIPFTPKEREHLLATMRREIDADTILYRAINPAKFKVSPAATIQIYKDQRVLLLSIGDGYIVSSLLEEKSIGDAFYGFFDSLSDSKLVYSKESTLQLVDDCIKALSLPADSAVCGTSSF